ncbi:MAG: Sip1-related alpha-galactosidase [Planctomycetota bacterium]
MGGNPDAEPTLGDWWDGPAKGVGLRPDARSAGAWLVVRLERSSAEFAVGLGRPVGWLEGSACYRENVCWMRPWRGGSPSGLPQETQFVLYRVPGGYRLIVPVLDGGHRMSLAGTSDGGLVLHGDSGDPAVTGRTFDAAYVLHGQRPHLMIRQAARAIARQSAELTLREDKPVPAFVDDVGWCSYNAFYSDISHDKVCGLLDKYAQAGVLPGVVILDEGWMRSTADQRLTSFDADADKFPQGLLGFVRDLQRRGVRRVLLWHAFAGYWRGAEPGCFNGTPIAREGAYLSPRLRDRDDASTAAQDQATVGEAFYPHHVVAKPVGVSEPSLAPFYDAFHRSLKDQGIDGVKIDAMSWAEMHGRGRGGRVAILRDLVRAAEASTGAHLDGNLLNCSSCSSDFYLQTRVANVTRTSCDFFPDRPETHGQHLWINAHVSTWLGEWVLPDWDMFQTGHEAGPYHAAARAISGGPVYATDEPDRHNPALLRRLASFDGRVPRCLEPARVAEDNLMVDPTRDDALLKVANRNRFGGVLGLFHCRSGSAEEPELDGVWRPTDVSCGGSVPLPVSGRYACWSEARRALAVVTGDQSTPVRLGRYGFEVVTLAPIDDGFAPIGLEGLLNPGGAVLGVRRTGDGVEIDLLDGGAFMAYAEHPPQRVEAWETPSPTGGMTADRLAGQAVFEHDPTTGLLRTHSATGQRTTLRFVW